MNRLSRSPKPDFAVKPRRSECGFTLIEMLVYMGLFVVLMGVGYAAFHRCLGNSLALRRNADDIANALHAGENWRADVRAARGPARVESSGDEQVLELTGPQGPVAYRFAANTVFRRVGNNDWSPVLNNVQASSFTPDKRPSVEALRWELELQPRAKRMTRIRPLFTFIAVPVGEVSR
jgi:prepilin-type N-terminal cleavage/methylation domain-containing protein